MNKTPVLFKTKKQEVVSLSSAEAEFIALSHGLRLLQWLLSILSDLKVDIERPVIVYCDNQSAIKMITKDEVNTRSKHIDVRYFHTKDMVKSGTVTIKYIPTEENVADLLTKVVSGARFSKLSGLLLS